MASVVVLAEGTNSERPTPIEVNRKLSAVGPVGEPLAKEVVPNPLPSAMGLMEDLRLLEAFLAGLPQNLVLSARTAF